MTHITSVYKAHSTRLVAANRDYIANYIKSTELTFIHELEAEPQRVLTASLSTRVERDKIGRGLSRVSLRMGKTVNSKRAKRKRQRE